MSTNMSAKMTRRQLLKAGAGLGALGIAGAKQDHRDVAVVAFHQPAAAMVRAGDVVGVSAAVEQKQHLAAVVESAPDRLLQDGPDQVHATICPSPLLLAEVDDPHLRHVQARHTLLEAV